MKSLLVSILLSFASLAACGALVYSQWPGNPPGGGIPSQWWYDLTQQNNLDSDAEAYDDFTLTQAKTITHVEWWGEAGPSVGFFIGFYKQDTNTIAYQPDLQQFHGHPPIAYETVTNFTQTPVGNGIYHFSADLPAPVILTSNTTAMPRYFISIADSMPLAYYTWGWAQGFGGNNLMFYFQLAGSPAGGPYYTYRYADRAFAIYDDSPWLAGCCIKTNMVFTWPTNSAGFVLQQIASLGSTNWANVTNSITVMGTNNQVVVSNPAGVRFFRLMRP